MAGGYYPIYPYDARQLSVMIGQLSTDRSRVNRAQMTLYLWSQMQHTGKPCPYIRTGVRTLAKECGVTEKTARSFLEKAEALGWIVRLGSEKNKGGQFTKRTFIWVAEEAAEQSGHDVTEWLEVMGGVPQKGHGGVPQTGHTTREQPQEKGAHRCALNPIKTAGSEGGSGTHQSTEYSEGDAARISFEVDALASRDEPTPMPRPDGWSS